MKHGSPSLGETLGFDLDDGTGPPPILSLSVSKQQRVGKPVW